jgi:hypothetical protein
MRPVTRENIEAVLEYLPYFEDPHDTFYTVIPPPPPRPDGTPVIYIDPYEYSRQVQLFRTALYENDLVQPFDWPGWQDEAAGYVNDPARVESADLETLIKLLTTHIRKERFCAGHLACMIDCGHVLHLMRRLDVLRWTVPSAGTLA